MAALISSHPIGYNIGISSLERNGNSERCTARNFSFRSLPRFSGPRIGQIHVAVFAGATWRAASGPKRCNVTQGGKQHGFSGPGLGLGLGLSLILENSDRVRASEESSIGVFRESEESLLLRKDEGNSSEIPKIKEVSVETISGQHFELTEERDGGSLEKADSTNGEEGEEKKRKKRKRRRGEKKGNKDEENSSTSSSDYVSIDEILDAFGGLSRFESKKSTPRENSDSDSALFALLSSPTFGKKNQIVDESFSLEGNTNAGGKEEEGVKMINGVVEKKKNVGEKTKKTKVERETVQVGGEREESKNIFLPLEIKPGDPLGRKVLGKAVVRWLQLGISKMAIDAVQSEIRGEKISVGESSMEAVLLARSYLAKHRPPPGCVDKCQLAVEHYQTIWDHIQREVQVALRAAETVGAIPDWSSSATWQQIKAMARSPEHRVTSRSRTPRSQQGEGEEPWSSLQIVETQNRIDNYVSKALELLKLERDAGLEATQESLNLEQSRIQKGSKGVSEEEGKGEGEERRELVDRGKAGGENGVNSDNGVGISEDRTGSLRKLRAVSSSTGLGGSHLVTLRAEPGQGVLLANSISPGESVCVRVDGHNGGLYPLSCMRGVVNSLGEDSRTVVVAIEARYGDPSFAKLFGKILRVDRISLLADVTTYDRNRDALLKLQKVGLQRKFQAREIVASLFGLSLDPMNLQSFSSQQLSSSLDSPSLDSPSPLELDSNSSFQTQETHKTYESYKNSNTSTSYQSEEDTKTRYSSFDSSQIAAIESVFDKKKSVTVIQGPPGTGKTSVAVEIIERAVREEGERVLVSAPTNAAVDNLGERLASRGIRLVRVGNPVRVALAVVQISLDYQVDTMMAGFRRDIARRRADLRRDLRQVEGEEAMEAGLRQMLKQLGKSLKQRENEVVEGIMNSAEVVLCTLTGAGDPLVQRQGPFGLVLLDEAGQATEPASWIPLLLGKRAAVTGDTCQLAPTILSQEAEQNGLGVSLMERAVGVLGEEGVKMLQIQYRMHEAIATWSSQEMYGGLLTSASNVAQRLLVDSPEITETWSTKCAMTILDTRLPRGTLLRDCEEMRDPFGSGSLLNEGEADIVKNHIVHLINAGVSPSSIVVQSPYLAQVQLIQSRLDDVAVTNGVEVSSIDAFQGREAEAVVISMVRSNSMGSVGFLGDRRRMNVAVTRAKCHVAIVCDSTTISQNLFLRRLLQHVRNNVYGEIRCAESYTNFSSTASSTKVEGEGEGGEGGGGAQTSKSLEFVA